MDNCVSNTRKIHSLLAHKTDVLQIITVFGEQKLLLNKLL